MPNRSTTLRLSVVLLSLTGLTASAPVANAAKGHHSKAHAGAHSTGMADLILRDFNVDIGDDGQLAVSGRVANTGSKRAARSDVVIAISDDPTLDDDDAVLDDVSLRKIKPGKSRVLDAAVEAPSEDDLPSGTVYLLVCADGNGAVKEKSESNNCQAEVIADASDDSGAASDDGSSDAGDDSGDDGTASQASISDDGSDA